MKLYTPPTPNWGSALLTLSLGLICHAGAASYTLTLHQEAHPGKYTATPQSGLGGVLANYNVKATSSSGSRFWTFCMESTEYFQSGRTYNGVASSTTDSKSGADPLSVGTAYLYEQFALGQLDSLVSGFSYDNSGGLRLQKMIWWLENEAGGTKDNAMWTLLDSTFGNEALDTYTGSSVGVLNLTKYVGPGGDNLASSYGAFRQDQLVFWGSPQPGPSGSPVPDGGTTLALLGLSLGGLGICRRWHSKGK